MTHKDLATLQVSIYERANGNDVPIWDYFQDGSTDNDVLFGIHQRSDVTVVAFPGSRTARDWFRDFMAITNPFTHDVLGKVHPGFQIGISGVWKWIKANTNPPWVIQGHSLGAARATVLTGYMCADGMPPLARVVWGEPKSCFSPMAEIISKAGVQMTSYRNRDTIHYDLVTSVPLTLLMEEYVRCGELTDVCAPPPKGDSWGLLGYHHMQLYASATPETLVTL